MSLIKPNSFELGLNSRENLKEFNSAPLDNSHNIIFYFICNWSIFVKVRLLCGNIVKIIGALINLDLACEPSIAEVELDLVNYSSSSSSTQFNLS